MSADDLPALLRSNTADAVSGRLFDTVFHIVAVTGLSFSTAQIGLLNAIGSASFLLFAVPIGAMVDRRGPVRVLRAGYALKVLLLAAVVAAYTGGLLGAVVAMLLVAVLGVVTLLCETAQASVTPLLAEQQEHVGSVIARMASADELAGIVVPGFAGLWVASLGGTWPLVGAVLLATMAVAFFRPVHRSSSRRRTDGVTPTQGSPGWSAGFGAVVHDRFLLSTVLLVAAGNVGLAIGDSVDAVLVLRHLHLGAAFYGFMGTVAAAAGFVGTVLAPRVVRTVPVFEVFRWGALLQMAVASLPLVAATNPAVARPVLLTFSAAWSIVLILTNIAGAAYASTAVDPAVLGRSAAARRMMTMGCVPVAALAGGLLGDAVGIEVPLIIWPSLTATAAIIFFALGRRPQAQHDA